MRVRSLPEIASEAKARFHQFSLSGYLSNADVIEFEKIAKTIAEQSAANLRKADAVVSAERIEFVKANIEIDAREKQTILIQEFEAKAALVKTLTLQKNLFLNRKVITPNLPAELALGFQDKIQAEKEQYVSTAQRQADELKVRHARRAAAFRQQAFGLIEERSLDVGPELPIEAINIKRKDNAKKLERHKNKMDADTHAELNLQISAYQRRLALIERKAAELNQMFSEETMLMDVAAVKLEQLEEKLESQEAIIQSEEIDKQNIRILEARLRSDIVRFFNEQFPNSIGIPCIDASGITRFKPELEEGDSYNTLVAEFKKYCNDDPASLDWMTLLSCPLTKQLFTDPKLSSRDQKTYDSDKHPHPGNSRPNQFIHALIEEVVKPNHQQLLKLREAKRRILRVHTEIPRLRQLNSASKNKLNASIATAVGVLNERVADDHLTRLDVETFQYKAAEIKAHHARMLKAFKIEAAEKIHGLDQNPHQEIRRAQLQEYTNFLTVIKKPQIDKEVHEELDFLIGEYKKKADVTEASNTEKNNLDAKVTANQLTREEAREELTLYTDELMRQQRQSHAKTLDELSNSVLEAKLRTDITRYFNLAFPNAEPGMRPYTGRSGDTHFKFAPELGDVENILVKNLQAYCRGKTDAGWMSLLACPKTHTLLQDPVIADDQVTYNGSLIHSGEVAASDSRPNKFAEALIHDVIRPHHQKILKTRSAEYLEVKLKEEQDARLTPLRETVKNFDIDLGKHLSALSGYCLKRSGESSFSDREFSIGQHRFHFGFNKEEKTLAANLLTNLLLKKITPDQFYSDENKVLRAALNNKRLKKHADAAIAWYKTNYPDYQDYLAKNSPAAQPSRIANR